MIRRLCDVLTGSQATNVNDTGGTNKHRLSLYVMHQGSFLLCTSVGSGADPGL